MPAYDDWGQRSSVLLAILSSERAIIRAMTESAAKADITLQQYSVLGVLSRLGPVPMNRLSEELRVTPPNITGVVDRLEKKELVKREGSSKDRRRKEIRLTAKGAGLYERVRVGYSESLQESLDAFTAEEQETLAKLLKKLAKEMARKDGAGPQRSKKLTDG
ncbi:MAG TPA: MarR family transcriptional regulator [Nitrososphaerales archaeon]|nr:MarR family transcriptional regulator [Nitrososphaerales archaeon]